MPTSNTQSISTEALLDRARAMQPMLRETAATAKANGMVSQAVIDSFLDAEFFKLLMPKKFGGLEGKYADYVRLIAELTKGDSAAGWVYMITGYLTGTAAELPSDSEAAQIFADQRVVCCGVNAMSGTATKVDGGYRVSGEWGWSSGCHNANWFLGGVLVDDGSGGEPEPAFCFIPMSQTSTKNTWKVAAMQGTGSDSVIVQDVVVPEGRIVLLRDRMLAESEVNSTMGGVARLPIGVTFALGISAAILGMADTIRNIVVADMGRKAITHWNFAKGSDSATVLHKVGEAAMQIETAWLHVLRGCNDMEAICAERAMTVEERAKARCDAAHASEMCRRAADTLVSVAGSGSFASSSLVNQYWSDLSMASRHAQLNSHLHYEVYGRALGGLDPRLSAFI